MGPQRDSNAKHNTFMTSLSFRRNTRLKSLAQRVGVEVRHYRPAAVRRARLLTEYEIDYILDVGANVGQYGRSLRAIGYEGRILSFEPLQSAYEHLKIETNDDPLWDARRVALGETDGEATLHVGRQPTTSSLLDVAESHLEVLPASIQEEDQTVPLARLDHVDIEVGSRSLLKLDVQGLELQVLKGAAGLMGQLTLLECELSIVSLYEQQPLITDILGFLRKEGFELIALEPGFYDPATGKYLQFDGIFRRQVVDS